MKQRLVPLSLAVVLAAVLVATVVLLSSSASAGLSEASGVAAAVPAQAQPVLLDDLESHRWIGEPWGNPISLTWTSFDGREVVQIDVLPGAANWALMRTDAFPAEDWEEVTAVRGEVYKSDGAPGLDLKLEVRGLTFDPVLVDRQCNDLPEGAWTTCTWPLPSGSDLSQVSHLSLVVDHLATQGATLYLDELRLVDASGEALWDDFADSSREWFYFGNWYDWNAGRTFGLEPISHLETTTSSPSGALFLQWDKSLGVDPAGNTAEVGTMALDDVRDWRPYTHVAADVWISDADAPISVFLWNAEGPTEPFDARGLGTPTRKAGVAGSWRRLTWDLPWPAWFDASDIDELKFVVNNLDQHPLGLIYIDNINLIRSPYPEPLDGLAYVFEDFNDNDSPYNDFSGNWGLFASQAISAVRDRTIYSGTWGASLRVDYVLSSTSAAGVWQSLWGSSAVTDSQYLDLTDFYGRLEGPPRDIEQIQFWVRGSGLTTGTHQVKVELKDTSGAFERTAYRYVAIDDADTDWRRIALDADVSNGAFWSYNGAPPDPTRMKQLVLVVESFFNQPQGRFYLDEIQLIDGDDAPFELTGSNDEAFLDLVGERTFLYFLDNYDPKTGLFQDRSAFADLMSTASTGFGLTALAIGEDQGWIARPTAVSMISRTLNTLLDGQEPAQTVGDVLTLTNGYRGFFYHFLDEDGRRGDTGSELSPVDTAILLFGALTVQQHFANEPAIVEPVDQLLDRVQWDWMLDDSPGKNWFYLAWQPACGDNFHQPASGGGCFSDYYWNVYTDEAIMINLLAIGSRTHPVTPDVFYAWERSWGSYGDETLIMSWNGSAFIYFFAHLWLDFAQYGLDAHPDADLRVDWWENSIAALRANRQFAIDHQDTECDEDNDYRTYGPNSWGLTAAEGPEGDYHAYGTPPVTGTIVHSGTVAPYGAGSAIIFLPDEATAALKHYFSETDLWRYRFGFGDAYNLDPPGCEGPWINHVTFGIDQGPLLLALANQRNDFVWRTIWDSPTIVDALLAVGYPRLVYQPIIIGGPK